MEFEVLPLAIARAAVSLGGDREIRVSINLPVGLNNTLDF